MKRDPRVEILGGNTIASFSLRVPTVFLPHVVLVAIIVLASLVGAVANLLSWAGL